MRNVRSAQGRRRLASSSSNGDTEIEIVASTGPTSTDWSGASYVLEVGTLALGQTQAPGYILVNGTIDEGEESPQSETINLERGCYVIYASAGARPYDVIWQVRVDGELYQDVEGGGQDNHTFGVGGALCDLSECYQQCYAAHVDESDTECASFSDLLAPLDEPAGAQCRCAQEEVELRLTCLERGCERRSQCYLLDDSQITITPTLRMVMYVTVVDGLVDTLGMETAVAQWLDLDPAYVELELVNGIVVESSVVGLRRRRRRRLDVSGEEEGVWVYSLGTAVAGEGGWTAATQEDWKRQARDRGLQQQESFQTFKRLEFRITGDSADDFTVTATIDEDVPGLNVMLAAQGEASGVQQVEAYTVEYQLADEYMAVADVPLAPAGGEEEIVLANSDNDPDLLMMSFSHENCGGTGIAVLSGTNGTKIMEITRYTDENGQCGAGFDSLHGTVCESLNATYTWGYTSDQLFVMWECDIWMKNSMLLPFQSTQSDTVLCNDGIRLTSLVNLDGDDEGLVYATPVATNFDDITRSLSTSVSEYCYGDLTSSASSVLAVGVDNVLAEPDATSSGSDSIAYEIIIPVVCALIVFMGCGCYLRYRYRNGKGKGKGKESRADRLRRNLGFTPDMESEAEGDFVPTNKHAAITRGGGPQAAPEMHTTKSYTQSTCPPTHHRTPSEAPSSAKSWEERKEHKELKKPPSQQHVFSAGPTDEELNAENARSRSATRSASRSGRSEQSLNQAAKSKFPYTYEGVEEDDSDDEKTPRRQGDALRRRHTPAEPDAVEGGGMVPPSAPARLDGAAAAAAAAEDGGAGLAVENDATGGSAKKLSAATTSTGAASTTNISTAEQDEVAEYRRRHRMADAAPVAGGLIPEGEASGGGGTGASSAAARQSSAGDIGLGHAVLAAAQELARSCQIPGVSEVAGAVSVMAKLFTDSRENPKASYSRLRQCHSVVLALKRADKVVSKGGDTIGEAARVLIEDVHDAIFDLVQLIRTFKSKNNLSKLLLSTLFKRRQDELDAVVNQAIMRLQLGLQVQAGHDMSSMRDSMKSMEDEVSAVNDAVKAMEEGMQLSRQGSVAEATSESVAEARKIRRQRKLDQVEIPEEHLFITTDLLGKGGFGEVCLADYNGHNAAAKVLHITQDPGALDENQKQRETRQRRAFLRELEAMIRLRSPNTVNIFGAVTSLPDLMVLVMELLPNGDLLTLLRASKKPLPEEQSRRIIRDICTGMAFLHSKNTVHGDLKSANVLLDGDGRAKIADFGTSRWSQHTDSTGLATYTTQSRQTTQMSIAWSAPEVLDSKESSYASDVYSFGIVVWEVISRKLPWAKKTRPSEILLAVLKGVRPSFHVDAPADIVDIANACWRGNPRKRTTFRIILEDMKAKGWSDYE